MNRKNLIIMGISSIIIFLIIWALGCWLWGAIAVGIFGLPALNCWEFLGLEVLCSILFKAPTPNLTKENR